MSSEERCMETPLTLTLPCNATENVTVDKPVTLPIRFTVLSNETTSEQHLRTRSGARQNRVRSFFRGFRERIRCHLRHSPNHRSSKNSHHLHEEPNVLGVGEQIGFAGPSVSGPSSNCSEQHTKEEKKGICGFLERTRKAVKRCCKTRVEPIVADEPVPCASGLKQTADREQINFEQTSVSVPSDTEIISLQDDEENYLEESFESVYERKLTLGKGCFGEVFMAIRKSDGQEVAVKSIRKCTNDTYISIAGYMKLVITEVAMMIRLQQPPTSPYVIQMFEWFDYPDHIEIVLEYLASCLELMTLISRCALNEEKVRVIMHQAAQAIKHCLDHGVFHNDIHTGNILVNTRTFHLKLIDFGCALEYTSDPYPNHKYRGAYDYRPPEVKCGGKFDGNKTNVYQLGKLLEKMFLGCRPRVSQECRDFSKACQAFNPCARPTVEKLLENKWFENLSSPATTVSPQPSVSGHQW